MRRSRARASKRCSVPARQLRTRPRACSRYSARPAAAMAGETSVAALASEVVLGQRRALSRAITLLESTRPDDERAGEELIQELAAHAGKGLRVAFTGPPGVGKSTLIDALGLLLIELGRRVAVLAVDPS